ncbi:ABC transporter ATP-binding protein [Roseibium sp. DSM 29163]|uniref:ABC transporter ATP-binding protein n=1 Tax=Roseibium salinum TaxID=1604349 RepID=A0ABT3QYX7_9HYPH|nr:ABC transporter ATP-binding protein [Roseibium sp. DSM 29163]
MAIEELKTPLIGPVDLSLGAGSCVSVSGPSGSGKTLFLRAIADLDVSSGAVFLKGVAREAMAATQWRRKVAFIPAESGWWAERVRDHFEETPELEEQLEAVGLGGSLSWQIARLSTGERQRLALVRALQLHPEVLLLDEPTSALDPPSVKRVEALLEERMHAGCAILLVTHDPDQPKRLGARRFKMTGGRLTADQPQEVAR